MSKPRVTILLPNYNNASYLKDCIESVQAQTFKEFKLLFIDDGSTDNSVELYQSYADPRFELVEKKVNSGIVDTLNLGLDKLDTEFMIRLDGDDYMTDNRLELLVKYMDEHPNIDVCGSALQMFGTHDQTVTYEQDVTKNKANMIFNHTIGHATLIFRSHLFTELGYRYKNDFKYMEDYHLLFDMRNDAACTTIPDVLYFYRQTEAHLPQQMPESRRPTCENFYDMILKTFDQSLFGNGKLHFELARLCDVTYSLKEFEEHCEAILYFNKKKEVFPHDELKGILTKALNRIQFRMIDQGILGMSEVIKKPKLYKYYLRSKI